MKVLFLSLPTGHGHNMCAKAAIACLEQKGVECRLLDVAEFINPIYSKAISRGFLLSARTGILYDSIYRFMELKEPSPKISTTRLINALLPLKLKNFLKVHNPDAIVCTHVFAAQMLTELKRTSKVVTSKTYGIITDFTVHPYWEDTELDYYVLPHELLAHQFVKKGLDKEKILPFGIPVYEKFNKDISKLDARKSLGFENKPTILIMGGSMGFGKTDKMIAELDKLDIDFQIIAVCGNNSRLKKKIDKLQVNKKVHNYGFVDNVDVLMSASDAIVTKPGGLTTSEALAKGLFIIMPTTFPGQEERNSEFLLANGLAMRASKTFPLEECIYEYLNNQERRLCSSALAKSIAKPHAAKDLCEHIMLAKHAY